MKTYGGVDVEIQVFLTSVLVGGEWSASRPGKFIPGGYPLDRRLCEPQNPSGRSKEENIYDSVGTRTPTPLSSSQ
jgi:hypothetical protein